MPDKNRQKMMPGQLSEEELIEIREKEESSNDNSSEKQEKKITKNNFLKKFIN
jgi:hypothetical protein